jgi:hypothetical protein
MARGLAGSASRDCFPSRGELRRIEPAEGRSAKAEAIGKDLLDCFARARNDESRNGLRKAKPAQRSRRLHDGFRRGSTHLTARSLIRRHEMEFVTTTN